MIVCILALKSCLKWWVLVVRWWLLLLLMYLVVEDGDGTLSTTLRSVVVYIVYSL